MVFKRITRKQRQVKLQRKILRMHHGQRWKKQRSRHSGIPFQHKDLAARKYCDMTFIEHSTYPWQHTLSKMSDPHLHPLYSEET